MLKRQKEDRERARNKFYDKLDKDNQYRNELGDEVTGKEIVKRDTFEQKKTLSAKNRSIEEDPYLTRIQRITDEKVELLRKEGVEEEYIANILKLKSSFK